jgi:hypothetical protein
MQVIYEIIVTNKRLFIYKTDQHATRFSCSIYIWAMTIHISCDPHVATFHVVVNRVEQGHCSREKGLPTQSTAHRLTDPRVHT